MIEFLAANWPWLAALAFFVAMHRGGRGCGMHGGHSDRDHTRPAERAGTDRSQP